MPLSVSPFSRGLTLCELAFILLLLGLLSGFFLMQSNLFTHAELRTIAIEAETHVLAMERFKNIYDYYPGDIPNATNYWYDDAHCPGVVGLAKACNGNGNDVIAYDAPSPENNEGLRAWQHLAFSRLLPRYKHATPRTIKLNEVLAHAPLSGVRNGQWRFAPYFFTHSVKNSLMYGSFLEDNAPLMPLLTPEEIFYLDNKMDDGMPKTGRLQAQYQGVSSCIVLDDDRYNMESSEAVCMLFFLLDENGRKRD